MDFLDDPFLEPVVAKASIARRFQPKVGLSAAVPSAAVNATKKPSVTSVLQNQTVQSKDPVDKKSDTSKSSSLPYTESSGFSVEYGNLSAEAREVAGSAVIGHSGIVVSNLTTGRDLSADSSLGTTVAHWPAETSTLNASIQNEEETPVSHNVSFASASLVRPCNSHTAFDQSIDKTSTFQDYEGYKESIVCGDGDIQIDVEQLEAGDFSCLNAIDIMTEGAAVPEKRAIKFQPKPKALSDEQKYPVGAVSHLPNAPEFPSDNQHMTGDASIHAGEPDTMSEVLHMRLGGNLSLDPSTYQPDTVLSEDAHSLMPETLPQQSGDNHVENDALDSSVKSIDEGFLSRYETNENGYDLLDGTKGGFHDNSSSYDRALDETASNRDENNDGDHLVEEISQKKRPRKSKKVATENCKPARKRTKAAQEPKESAEKPPKKFPRATRQKRCVDKSLLEAPEHELDLQRVPIRDLIILAEYKERQAKKEAAAVLPQPTNARTDNMSPEDAPYVDCGTFGFDQDGDACNNPSTSGVQKDTGYFNYQSFMKKEPRARWTKLDTELFYKGISQFGSDLSMIQQLFPGRTRHQIKLKYKKEERQNPMRLHDALTSRSQDLSHFELVIERLQEQAARDAKTDKDDSVCATGNEEGPEEVLKTHEDVANSKQNEDGGVVDQELDKCQVDSPPKSYHSEEEDFDWSEYKSEL